MKKRSQIAFFGSSLVSAYWNGAATYYRGIIRALWKRGHQITFFEPDIYDRQSNRDIEDPPYANVVVYNADKSDLKRVLSQAAASDIIIKTSGVGIFDDILEKSVLECKNNNNKIIFWDVDAPATLDRITQNPEDQFVSLIKEYDLIFTYGGGKPVVEKYSEFGAKKCIPVYNAIDPDIHYPVQSNKKFHAHLAFLGNRLPDREQRVHEFFFKPARILPEYSFLLGGSGWDTSVPTLENVTYYGHVFTHEHNQFNCSSEIVLNVNRNSMARFGYSPATRIFEAAGAGACIISDQWEGIDEFLEPGQEILVASDGEDVAEYLQTINIDTARKIGTNARNKVLQNHTYSHRSQVIEQYLL